jgi:methylmalonyl-CoA mutase cobalamin-binding domain/chain
MANNDKLENLKATIIDEASEEEVVAAAKAAVEAGISAKAAIDAATEAIRVVGEQYECGDKYLPELMIAANKMEACLNELKPLLTVEEAGEERGRIVIGTVSGDIHDLGKNLVATMLSMGGYDITDVGINVAPFDFITSAKDKRANMIALSSLMTTSLPYQTEVLDLLRDMGERNKFFVIVGGGPVTPEFAEKVGADGYAEKAGGAIKLCDTLMSSGDSAPLEKPLL